MQAGDVRLGKVFANDHQNVIPLFQRPYVWEQEDNWDPLWKDVRKAAEEVEREAASHDGPADSPPTYFLGAVVRQERRRPPGRLSSSHIIDGQQRLTTLQVLLAAARHVATAAQADSVAGRFRSLLENRSETIHEEFPEDTYKVWPLPQDRDAFLWAVRAPTDYRDPPDPDHRLAAARRWFEQEISEWANSTDASPKQRLDHLYFALQERIQLVEISLDSGDDPQVIFEALNHRGVRLAAADLVKNLLFQLVESQGEAKSAEGLLAEGWADLDGKYWRSEVTTGRIRRVLVDLLLTYWLTIQSGQEVLVDHLFADFKKWLKEEGSLGSDVIRSVRHHADTYRALTSVSEDHPAWRLLDSMRWTGTTTPWPVLLHLYADPDIPDSQRVIGVSAIDSYLMRRGVCVLTAKDYNRLFVQVVTAATEAGASRAGSAVADTLAAQTADSRLWPSDEQFRVALLAPGMFERMYRTRLKSLLIGLENALRTGKTEGGLLRATDQSLNIEHVLPQVWQTNWSLSPHSKEAELARETAKHRLGNLTITTVKMNSSLSNAAWEHKQRTLATHSLARLTTSSVLRSPTPSMPDGDWVATWDEQRIETRSQWLADISIEQWPRPT